MFNPFKHKHKSSVEIVLKKKIECLVLIGDSILDNFYGLHDKKKDVEYQIMLTLNKSKKGGSYNSGASDNKENKDDDKEDLNLDRNIIRLYNLSLYSIDCEGVLSGMEANELYIQARKKHKLRCYPLDKDNILHPIKILSSMVMNKEIKISQKNKDKNHINATVILSVGFYDLFNAYSKYGKTELIIESLRKDRFAEKYEKIVHLLIDNLGVNLIIIIPYEPHESFTEKQLHFSRDDLLTCMEFVATKIMQVAEKYKCPIIDLSRTLNPYDRNHYGDTYIEPSMTSGQFIVDLIIKVLSIWDWNAEKRKSKIYYGLKTQINHVDNDKTYRGSYFNALQSRALVLNKATENPDEMDLLADLFATDPPKKK